LLSEPAAKVWQALRDGPAGGGLLNGGCGSESEFRAVLRVLQAEGLVEIHPAMELAAAPKFRRPESGG
jgi:hypothetical protein